MQTFLSYSSFEESAKVLDRQRLGKQRVETLQLLQSLECGPYQIYELIHFDGYRWISATKEQYDSTKPNLRRKTPWYKHPCARMWLGFEGTLAAYGIYMCDEWIKRGYKDNCKPQLLSFLYQNGQKIMQPSFLGDEKFHSSHRAALLYKNYSHYSQFGWKEEPKLEYFWPV